MKIGKCKICGKIDKLQKHHYIPQRIKKTNHYVYICDECHKKIHAENALIIQIKILGKHHRDLKSFIKTKYPEVWKEWKPIKNKIKESMKEKYGKQLNESLIDD